MVLRGRVMFLRLVVIAVVLTLMGRLVWVQVVRAEEIVRRGEEIRLVRKEVKPIRGKIMDRNGHYLAVSVPSYQVVANHLQIGSTQEKPVADGLAALLGLKADELLKKLKENPRSGYIVLASKLSLEQKKAVEELKLPGLSLVQQTQRQYPDHFTANKIIGYISDGRGRGGVEGSYEEALAGKPGWVTAEFTLGETPIEGTIKDQSPAEPGRNVVLTIDAPLQQLIEKKLAEVVKETKAAKAMAIAMDVKTGEILVMAETPQADPGDPKTWGEPIDYARLNSWAVTPRPPGSIFKIITASAALEERAITLSTTFLDKGEIYIDGARIQNWDGYVTPSPKPETIADLLRRSSNIGMIQVGEKLKHDDFVKYLKGFGFLEKTGIDLDYEEEANTGGPWEEKRRVDWANMFIGQHLEVTPIQFVAAAAAVVNGGYLVQPHLVKEHRDADGKVVWSAPTKPKRQVISEQTSKEVRELLIQVIEKGYVNAMPATYTVGGKTGTAQKFENGRMKDRMGAHFIGFAPANDPRVVMLIMVDEPEGQGYGGIVASPIFAQLIPEVMRTIGVAPDKTPDKNSVAAVPKPTTAVVPDVAWLPTPWAESRLAEFGFVPRTSGTGTVVAAQSIKAGTSTKIGSVVELVLKPAGTADAPVPLPDFSRLTLVEAQRLATDLSIGLKASGTGFVIAQEPQKGGALPARGTLSITLGPKP